MGGRPARHVARRGFLRTGRSGTSPGIVVGGWTASSTGQERAMRFLFRPPAAEATGLLSLPWDRPLADWDASLLLEVPQRGISRHVVRFAASGGVGFALKAVHQRPPPHRYAPL